MSRESDPLSRDQPWLAGLYAAAVSGKVAFGRNAGRRVTRIGDQIDPESVDALASPRCATVSGFSLHANTSVPASDRKRLERLCRLCRRLHNRHYADPGVMRTSGVIAQS